MKKFLSLLLILTIALSITSFAVAEEKIKLQFSSWGDANEKAVLEKILTTFTAETGIEVEYLYIPEDYLTKITTMAASNELPDVGYMSEDATIKWANEGMLADMSALFDMEGFAEKLESNKFIDKDGRTVGISGANETIMMFYNRAYFTQMGVECPPANYKEAWTWDKFVEVCRQLTVDVNGKHPNEEGFDAANVLTYGCRIGKAGHILEPLLRSNGGGVYTSDFSDIALDKPESIEVLQAVADLINVEHVMAPLDAAVNSMDNSSCFLSNSVAMIFDGQWAIQSMAVAKEEDGIDWDVGVLPYFDTPVAGNTGGPMVVFNSTKHPQEAMLLASYLLTTDYVMEFINSGLWQPTTLEWYTNEDLLSKWIVPGVHPDHYREACVDYTLNCLQKNSFFTVGCTAQINDLYMPALDTAWLGTTTVQESIDTVITQCRQVYTDYLASIAK